MIPPTNRAPPHGSPEPLRPRVAPRPFERDVIGSHLFRHHDKVFFLLRWKPPKTYMKLCTLPSSRHLLFLMFRIRTEDPPTFQFPTEICPGLKPQPPTGCGSGSGGAAAGGPREGDWAGRHRHAGRPHQGWDPSDHHTEFRGVQSYCADGLVPKLHYFFWNEYFLWSLGWLINRLRNGISFQFSCIFLVIPASLHFPCNFRGFWWLASVQAQLELGVLN